MKFSVDVNMHLSGIRGWVAVEEPAKLKLYKDDVLLGEVVADLGRDDVKAAGLHPTGLCGFSFDASEYGLIEGDIYKVEVCSGASVVRVFRLYGDHQKMLKEFVLLELLPRDDLSYLEPTTDEVLRSAPCIFAYKKLMIRLRRGKRGKQSRGVFVGYDYESRESDFSCFRALTENYLSVWNSFLDSRYLWSVLDTLADYGTPMERLAALAASNYMYAERFFQTQHCLYTLVEKDSEEKIFTRQLPYWGGMKTNQLANDDALDVFLTRNLEILSHAPVVKSIFFKLLGRSSEEPGSLLGFNLSNSGFFAGVYGDYKKDFIK